MPPPIPNSPHTNFTRVKSQLGPLRKSSWVVLAHFSCTGVSSEKGGLSVPSDEFLKCFHFISVQFSSVAQSCPTLCDLTNRSTPGLRVSNSRNLLTLMSIESAMPSSHLILCRPLLLPPIPPSIRVFSNESTLRIRWPEYWSFSFSISPSKEIPGLISFRMDWLSPRSPRDSQESSPARQFKSINSSALSLLHSPTLTSMHDHWKNHSLD